MEIIKLHDVQCCKFHELDLGEFFQRTSTGSIYIKFSMEDQSNNALLMDGSSTWLIPQDEVVIKRECKLVVK